MDVRRMFDLTGHVALVTGGTGLYGRSISEALAEAGAHVVVASRNQARCEDWAAKLRDRGLQASAENYEQADEQLILLLRDRVLKRWKTVDVLVNNSVARPMRAYGDRLETWKQSMEVNATGLFAISRAFLDLMMERGKGSVINISSIQGVVAPDFNNYAGTDLTTPPDYHFHKHGLIGLTKYLAAVAGPSGVRVNAISPGGYDPKGAKEPFLSQYCRRVFLGRMAEHDDLKGVVVFLASEASRYITGQNIIVDGGYTC
jgi:NAD(P)-dependent dehydrogenase (short-subunit alcohol dehydrogenase family)